MEWLGCLTSKDLRRANYESGLAGNRLYAPRPLRADAHKRITVLVAPFSFNFAGKFTSNWIGAGCQNGLATHYRSLLYEKVMLAKGINEYALDYAGLRFVVNVAGDFSFDGGHSLSHLDKPRWLGRFGRLDLDSASEVGQCKHSYGVLLKVAKVVHGNLWFDLCGLPQAGPLEGRSQRAFSPPLHDVLEVRYGLRERLAQERRTQVDLSEACKIEPPELEPSVAFNADVRLRGI